MAQIKEIKTRIDSVKKTKKITQAMKMVAAAKFKRAGKAVSLFDAYYHGLKDILEDYQSRMEPDIIPDLMKTNNSPKEAIILITGDRGLCGAFNASVIKATDVLLYASPKDTELICLGSKGSQYYKNKPWTITHSHTQVTDHISPQKIRSILKPTIDQFLAGSYGKVRLVYSEFLSALNSNLMTPQLLPLTMAPENTNEEAIKTKTSLKSDYIYEPSKEGILSQFLSDYLVSLVYRALLSSKAAEEGARMAAMDAATDNAQDMIKDLTLLYNRTRQAAITTELTEIVSGAEAIH
ncbi:MAG: ATP synthase F1 subunit gamma [Candidatus Margulisbacteria bacterium]|nr:ATP synthase F1 subunit gamma [Candidatus Margulisiibacteriota bacterium]